MEKYYDRYSRFRTKDDVNVVSLPKIPHGKDDVYIIYDKSKHRFDMLSYRYYNDPNYAWLILLSNPQYGSLEFKIEDGVELRIPYPLHDAIRRFEK